jgi:hypothetical protein
LGAFDDGTALAPGVGTAPLDVRKDLAGLFAPTGGIGVRAGVLPGGANPLVYGAASMTYSIGAFHAVASRGSSDGAQLYGNDGVILIGTAGVGDVIPAPPGAGLSRIDIIWTRHPTNAENADTSSAPLIGVASGTAASVPVAPTIPVGSLELARNTMTSTATTTASAGNTITQTYPYTALRGAPIHVRNLTERTAVATYNGIEVWRLDTFMLERHNGTTWVNSNENSSFSGSGGPLAGASYDPSKPLKHVYVRGATTTDSSGFVSAATPAGCTSVLYASPVIELTATGSSAVVLTVRPTETTIAAVYLNARNLTGSGGTMPAGTPIRFGLEIVYQI